MICPSRMMRGVSSGGKRSLKRAALMHFGQGNSLRQHFVERKEVSKGTEGREEIPWPHWNLITKGQRDMQREEEREKVRREHCKYNLIKEQTT